MLRVGFDLKDFQRLANIFAAAGDQAPHAVRRGLNRAGDKARTQMKRTLVKQTGLKAGVIARALKTRRANFGSLSYEIVSRGGDISLKHFGPRETRKGVSAAPRGQRAVFNATFLKGGQFPNRKTLKMGGHVFARAGSKRSPIEKRKSGVFIPVEMVTGSTAAAFYAAANSHLGDDIARELFAILSGAAPRGRSR